MDCCISDECQKPAEKGRKYCHGHRKREKQRQSMDTPLREWGSTPNAYLEAKALELADAKGEEEQSYRRARKRFWFAVAEYIRKRQKVPNQPETTRRG